MGRVSIFSNLRGFLDGIKEALLDRGFEPHIPYHFKDYNWKHYLFILEDIRGSYRELGER